jgi:uncharacterized protein YggL (DUF469 family)
VSASCPVFGFLVELETMEALTSEQLRDLRLAFDRDVIEPRGLVIDARSSGRRWSFVVRSEASQATDSDRDALQAWTQTRSEIVSARIGPLLDFASVA